MTAPIPEQHRLIEFNVGDTVDYTVVPNTVCVVTAVSRRKFLSRTDRRINGFDRQEGRPPSNWVGQQLVRVRSVRGWGCVDAMWLPANQFKLAAIQKEDGR